MRPTDTDIKRGTSLAPCVGGFEIGGGFDSFEESFFSEEARIGKWVLKDLRSGEKIKDVCKERAGDRIAPGRDGGETTEGGNLEMDFGDL